MRSWIQSRGLVVSICASRNPVQPASCGCPENNSERVGLAGSGKRQHSSNPLGRRSIEAGRICVKTAPPATRDKPPATRLTTFLFFFCSFLATRRYESMGRLAWCYVKA